MKQWPFHKTQHVQPNERLPQRGMCGYQQALVQPKQSPRLDHTNRFPPIQRK